jgi:hypothetical protein
MFEALLATHVIVTFIVAPMLGFYRFQQLAKTYQYNLNEEQLLSLNTLMEKGTRVFFTKVILFFLIGTCIVGVAITTQSELLNWDDQAGLVVLFLLAVAPIIQLTLLQKAYFARVSSFQSGVRTASLQADRLVDYVSKPLLLLLIAVHFIFVGSVFYFMNHPFEGFAGGVNFLGLLILDGVFMATSYAIYHSTKFNAISSPAFRQQIKLRAIKINTIVWILAIANLVVSFWMSGSYLSEYKIYAQSIYLQVILVIGALVLSLPKQENSGSA